MSPAYHPTRRTLIKHGSWAALAVAGASSLSACATGGGGEDDATSGEKTDENPFGVASDAALSVVIFDGGYGDAYAKFHESIYKKQFADATIDHKAITDIRQQMQPLFNAGNPPDVLDNAGAEEMPISTLAETGQLSDLTDLLAADAIGFDGKKVKDIVHPAAIEAGTYDGKQMVVPYALQVYGLWYNKALFDEKGWEIAQTWPDFLALCEEIKGAGIAPMAYQGKYPYYIQQTLMDMAVKHGGHEVITAIDSLEPNAWKHESMLAAAEALVELNAKGYMLPGTDGLDHIQSQTRWSEGKVAFIPSGSWLENEQKEVTPDGFEVTVAPTPLLDGATLPFECTRVEPAEAFVVPTKAKNVAGGKEYLRIMLSKEGAAEFTKLTAAPTVVQGAYDGLDLTPGAASAIALIESGGDNNWNYYYDVWYSELTKEIETPIQALAAGRLTAQQFCDQAQQAADVVANNPKTKKRTRG